MSESIKSPEKSFNGQRDDEDLLFVFRRHIIAMRKGFYVLLVPFIITAIPPLLWSDKLELFLLPVAGFTLGFIGFLYYFLMWRYTYFIVTNQRIRQVTQHGFFGTDVVELNLAKIQNISYNIPGFSGEVFKFGTIVIQTFVGDLVIHNAEHPAKTYNRLQDAVNQAAKGQPQGVYEEVKDT
ncbi:PH domain-containing protein [Candidatus Saccharibacteria bacterium]|nr:PH domain-containing protein [Candidatus Saccharibacteria bacterium]